MKTLLRDPRYRRGLTQFVRFAIVGGLGFVVNNLVVIVCNVIGRNVLHVGPNTALVNLPGSSFNVRNYHAYVMIGFFVASLSNFVMNRYWTFKSPNRAHFLKEYLPFLAVGLMAQMVGMVLITLLMHPHSPIGLPSSVFNDSSGLRTKLYWANIIAIAFTTPINFVMNKLWTFRFVRQRHGRQVRAASAATVAEGAHRPRHLTPRA